MSSRTPSPRIRQIIAAIFIITTGCLCNYYGQQYLIAFGPNTTLTVIGVILIISGILLRLLAFREIRNTHRIEQLVTSGIYSVTRNPIYLAFSIIILGIAFLSPSILSFIWVLVSILIMLWVAKQEEADLEKAFGDAYLKYKREVPAFLPSFRKSRNSHP
jgi:protein-S-isoprenylcysteine O-methyltransferase Ste14